MIMVRFGDKVVIRDGSLLDGAEGIVYSVKEGQIQVLLDREVFWMVKEPCLELVVRTDK
jgi:ribosomal protein L24